VKHPKLSFNQKKMLCVGVMTITSMVMYTLSFSWQT